MPFANRGPTTDEATATAAALAAIVTPTIDEFEQAFANGSVDQLYCQQIIQPSSSNAIYQQPPPPPQQQQQPTRSGLENMIDAVLPYSSYYYSSQPPLPTQAFAEQAVSNALQYYNYATTSIASYATSYAYAYATTTTHAYTTNIPISRTRSTKGY